MQAAMVTGRDSIDIHLSLEGRSGSVHGKPCGKLSITLLQDGTFTVDTNGLDCDHCREKFVAFAAGRPMIGDPVVGTPV